jgi:UDP-N-acetylmuramate dehydrogenase
VAFWRPWSERLDAKIRKYRYFTRSPKFLMTPVAAELARSLARAGFGGSLDPAAPLAGRTTWRIGGPAEVLATPADRDDLRIALAWAAADGIPWRVLGNGSNLLVRDAGVRGLVLRVRRVLDDVAIDKNRIVAGAGASFPAVARAAARAGLSGLEFGAGIPGTIGGAVIMNAGWHEYEIGASIESVDYLDETGNETRIMTDETSFGYRRSIFRERRGIVLGATLRLTPGEPEEIRQRMDGYAESRKHNQPTELASCGSVFVKPDGDFAGRLIEAAGLKGKRRGAIEVSRKHANFFVNTGGGTATDVLALVGTVEAEVERRFDVRLVREFEQW